MPAIKKILFPVDFSERCQGAARYVEAFAGRFEAELMLLHAVSGGTNILAEEVQPLRQAELDVFLADELKYFTIRRMCEVGDPATRIVEAARSWGADLVMMPTHGVGLSRRLLLGSVTAKVLHDLDGPIWTGIHSEEAPPLEKITCRKVLCAPDLEERQPARSGMGCRTGGGVSSRAGDRACGFLSGCGGSRRGSGSRTARLSGGGGIQRIAAIQETASVDAANLPQWEENPPEW